MRCRAEAALVERERDLPGLGLVLDDARFCERLAKLLPDGDVRAARAVYLRYKPQTSCLVAYRVLGRDGERDVHALARKRGTPKLEKARRRARRHVPPRLFVLEDDAVVIALFPEDNELPVLARLFADDGGRDLLRALLGRDPGVDASLVRLRYKPERRWVGRLALAGTPMAVVKAYAEAGYETALRGSQAWVDRPPLRVPRVLKALPHRGLIALQWIEGRPLAEALLDGKAGSPEVALAGEALAGVHGQSGAGLPGPMRSDQAAGVLSVAAAIGFQLPALSARAHRLALEVAEGLEAPGATVAPTHGDFHAGQVLLAGGEAALIDFDVATLGAPATDLASFLAHLEWRAGVGPAWAGQAQALGEALLDGYARGGRPPSREELALHTAAALFRIAPHFFRDRDPAWPERTEAVLDRIESLLGGRAARARGAAVGERPA